MAFDPFAALADPIRREVLTRLAGAADGLAAGVLAEGIAIAQPSFSKHLRVLRDAGLVTARRDGRRRVYRLEPAAIRPVLDWVRHFDRFWDGSFDALGEHLAERSPASD